MMMRLQIIPREIFKVMNNISSSFSFPLLFVRQDARAGASIGKHVLSSSMLYNNMCNCVYEREERERERERERESIHLDISLLLYLFCCTLCYMLPSHIFQNSLIAASGVIENALIKYKMVTNTKSQFFEVQFLNQNVLRIES